MSAGRKKRQRKKARSRRDATNEDQDARLAATWVTEDPTDGDIDIKKGDWMVATSPVADADGNLFFYYPPQPIFFNLIEAKRHRDRGSSRRRSIMGNLKADQHDRLMPKKSDAVLDCLSDLVGAVLHAFTAIESFANHTIEQLPENAELELEHRGEKITLRQDEMVRRLSIAEKLDRAVPLHEEGKSAKGDAAWEKFVHLKRIRDDLIHVKARGYSTDPQKPSAYSTLLLGAGDGCVEEAVALIEASRPGFLDDRVLAVLSP